MTPAGLAVILSRFCICTYFSANIIIASFFLTFNLGPIICFSQYVKSHFRSFPFPKSFPSSFIPLLFLIGALLLTVMQSGKNGYVAMLRMAAGRGYKAPRYTCRSADQSLNSASSALPPNCSASNASSYLRLFPKNYSRYVAFGSTNKVFGMQSNQLGCALRSSSSDYSPLCQFRFVV